MPSGERIEGDFFLPVGAEKDDLIGHGGVGCLAQVQRRMLERHAKDAYADAIYQGVRVLAWDNCAESVTDAQGQDPHAIDTEALCARPESIHVDEPAFYCGEHGSVGTCVGNFRRDRGAPIEQVTRTYRVGMGTQTS